WRPPRRPSRKASSSRTRAATMPAVITVLRAEATWSRASPWSSRSLASMSSRLMRCFSWLVVWAIGLTCSLLLGDAADRPRDDEQRHHDDDQIRDPVEVALER